MKAIILAAGYATRLFPLTKDFPKPLLKINNKPMINYILEKIEEAGVYKTYVVTNKIFYEHFKRWQEEYNGKSKVEIINDNTTSNADRLGAIGDIKFALEQAKIDDDLMIIGGDNLFKFSLKKAYKLFKEKNENVIIGYDVKDLEAAKLFGVIEIDRDNKVLSFEEKPEKPKSTFCAICFYLYPKKTIKLLHKYLQEGNNPDAPGRFAAWLVKNHTVYAQPHDEKWFDIGGFEALKEAKEEYGEEDVDIEKLKKGIIA